MNFSVLPPLSTPFLEYLSTLPFTQIYLLFQNESGKFSNIFINSGISHLHPKFELPCLNVIGHRNHYTVPAWKQRCQALLWRGRALKMEAQRPKGHETRTMEGSETNSKGLHPHAASYIIRVMFLLYLNHLWANLVRTQPRLGWLEKSIW